jgi:hypothetical protein
LTESREAIRERLNALIERFPQAEVARRTGNAPANIHRYLHEGKIPAELCALLVSEFQVNPAWLLTGEGGMLLADVSGATRKVSHDLLGLVESMNAVARMRLGSVTANPGRRELLDLHDALESFERLREKLNQSSRPAFKAMLDELEAALGQSDLARAATLLASSTQLSRLCRDEPLNERFDALSATQAYMSGRVAESLAFERRVFSRRVLEGRIGREEGLSQAINLAMGLLDSSRTREALRIIRAAVALSADEPDLQERRKVLRLFEAHTCAQLGNAHEALRILHDEMPPAAGTVQDADLIVGHLYLMADTCTWEQILAGDNTTTPKLRLLLRHTTFTEDAERMARGLQEFIGAPPQRLPDNDFEVRLAGLMLPALRKGKGRVADYDAMIAATPLRGGSPAMRQARLSLHRAQMARLVGDAKALHSEAMHTEELLGAASTEESSKVEWLITRRLNLEACPPRSQTTKRMLQLVKQQTAAMLATGCRFLQLRTG